MDNNDASDNDMSMGNKTPNIMDNGTWPSTPKISNDLPETPYFTENEDNDPSESYQGGRGGKGLALKGNGEGTNQRLRGAPPGARVSTVKKGLGNDTCINNNICINTLSKKKILKEKGDIKGYANIPPIKLENLPKLEIIKQENPKPRLLRLPTEPEIKKRNNILIGNKRNGEPDTYEQEIERNKKRIKLNAATIANIEENAKKVKYGLKKEIKETIKYELNKKCMLYIYKQKYICINT